MLTRLKSSHSFMIAALVISVVVPECIAQGVRPCKNGSCGSPLAGPCVPARVTYGYVPTSWRRWPTDHAAADTKGPEQLPTPATHPETEPLPEPAIPGTALPGPLEPGGATTEPRKKAADESLTPPFGDAPTPSFSDEPPAFGDEPQAPPSAADPLADPFGDQPPTPPADVPSEPPAAPSDVKPSTGTPPTLDSDGPPAMPEEDLFKDDPFKDDPDPKTGTAPGVKVRPDEMYSASRARDQAALSEQGVTSGRPQPITGDSTTPTSEPRLLQANGESLMPSRLPEPMAKDANPLRQVSHPVRKTEFGAGAESPVMVPSQSTPAVWRHNPLRGS
jgi:hypothetical protein